MLAQSKRRISVLSLYGVVVKDNLTCKHRLFNDFVYCLFVTQHNHMIVANETGCNTHQNNDGLVGGERVIVRWGKKAQQLTAVKDFHFTIVGFTALSGKPVMASVIVAAEKMKSI